MEEREEGDLPPMPSSKYAIQPADIFFILFGDDIETLLRYDPGYSPSFFSTKNHHPGVKKGGERMAGESRFHSMGYFCFAFRREKNESEKGFDIDTWGERKGE